MKSPKPLVATPVPSVNPVSLVIPEVPLTLPPLNLPPIQPLQLLRRSVSSHTSQTQTTPAPASPTPPTPSPQSQMSRPPSRQSVRFIRISDFTDLKTYNGRPPRLSFSGLSPRIPLPGGGDENSSNLPMTRQNRNVPNFMPRRSYTRPKNTGTDVDSKKDPQHETPTTVPSPSPVSIDSIRSVDSTKINQAQNF